MCCVNSFARNTNSTLVDLFLFYSYGSRYYQMIRLYHFEHVCVCLSMVLSHFSTFLAVGPVVQVHVQLSCLDVSVDLPLPVMDQGGRTDDQSAVRNHESGVWMVNKQIIKKT